MTIKQRSLTILLTLALLAGCSNFYKKGGTATPSNKMLTVLTAKSAHATAWQSVIPDFEKETSIKVKVLEVAPEKFHKTLRQKFSEANADFDVAYVPLNWVSDLYQPGDIGAIAEGEKIKEWPLKDFSGIDNAFFGKKNKLYFIPYMQETHGIVYRTDLFNDPTERANFQKKHGSKLEPPKTLQQYRQLAEFFHRPDKNLNGVTLAGKGNMLTGFQFYDRLFNYGGNLYDSNFHAAFNNEAGVKALKDLKQLMRYASPDAKRFNWTDAANEFLQGRSAMAEMTTSLALAAQNPQRSKVVGKVGFTPFPGADATARSAASPATVPRLYVPYGFVRVQKSTLKKEAAQWIEFATRKAAMEKAAPQGNIPSRYSVLESKKLNDKYPFYRQHAAALKNVKWRPLPHIAEGDTIATEIVPNAVAEYLNDQLTAEEALEKAARQTEDLLKRHGYYKK